MPTYEYECKQCGYKFEKFQSMSADPVKDCPGCDMLNSVERLISGGAGISFKGNGFYVNDSKSSSQETNKKKS